MSIIAYVGLPGAGKSYGVVENVVLPSLRAGRTIVTNMPLKLDALRAAGGVGELIQLPPEVTSAKIAAEAVAGAVYVLDEVYKFWPAGRSADKFGDAEREFFAMHRHRVGADGRSTEIVIVVQDLASVATFVRNLVEQTYRMVKMAAFGLRKAYRVDVFEGCVTGPNPPASKRLREMYGWYKRSVYDCYQSHTQSVTGFAGTEQTADRRGNILRGFTFWLTVAALPVAGYMVWRALHIFSPEPQTVPVAGTPIAEQREASAAPRTGTPVASAPGESRKWRLAGFVEIGERSYALAESLIGTRRISPGACHLDALGDRRCLLEGELVTAWTGTPVKPIVSEMFGRLAEPKVVQ